MATGVTINLRESNGKERIKIHTSFRSKAKASPKRTAPGRNAGTPKL